MDAIPSPTLQEFLFDPATHRFPWQMGWSDRLGLQHLLALLRPAAALEIGTRDGGSLEVIARASGRTCSIDIDPAVAERLRPHFPAVEFRTGDSRVRIPEALAEFERRGEDLQFVLVDGDHTERGARSDLDLVLAYRPRKTMCVVVHDSFNPDVRRGILGAAWSANPHVHFLDLDFTTGALLDEGGKVEAWGGLALAVLYPTARPGALTIAEETGLQFRVTDAALRKRKWWPFS